MNDFFTNQLYHYYNPSLQIRQISAFVSKNRSLDDKSTKFGTQVEDTIRKSFGYRAIAKLGL